MLYFMRIFVTIDGRVNHCYTKLIEDRGEDIMPPEYNVRAVERALAILDCFSIEHTSFSLMEISKEIQLSASTTLRLLSTLEKRNYLYRNPDNSRYYLGAQCGPAGNAILPIWISARRPSRLCRSCAGDITRV